MAADAAEGEVTLAEGLKPAGPMPKHVAVIMDGHRRWARQRGLTVEEGHRAGGNKLRLLIRLCGEYGVKTLSVFAFSTENWVRPKEEVDFLMELFLVEANSLPDADEAVRDGLRVSIIGDKSKLSETLQEALTVLEETTKSNSGLHLLLAINYSGRYDILQATKNIASRVKDGFVQVEDIDKSLFEQQLETNCTEFSSPDLLIRTSGEKRVSNFMLWQLAYTELYFVDKMFPDFEEADFVEALMSFRQRGRRYGGNK